MSDKTYTFGARKDKEKIEKNIKNKQGVWDKKQLQIVWSNAFKEQVKQASKLINDDKYSLTENDFWINERMSGEKLYYVGLIISHNGCLKINYKLDKEQQYKPSCASIYKDNEKSLVLEYKNDEQGIHEFGEVHYNSKGAGCTVDFVYAMALKRLQDRVILKNSQIAFEGFYSESEANDFKKDDDIDNTTGEKKPAQAPRPAQQNNNAEPRIDQAGIDRINRGIQQKHINKEGMLAHHKVSSVEELTLKQYDEIIDSKKAKGIEWS